MTYVVHVTMIEEEDQRTPVAGTKIHVEGKYEYKNLEIAREAAEVACHAALRLRPARSKAMDDDNWAAHPDRSD